MIRTVLTDARWEIIAPHCLDRECDPGRTGPDPRRIVEAVLWIARTGCPWRDPPEEFGKWNSVFKRFRRWVKADAFYRMFKPLSMDADLEYVMIDGSIVKVHRHGQAHDLRGTAALIDGHKCGQLLGDRAFDADWLRVALIGAGIEPVIPPKSNRRFPAEFDRDTYKWHRLIGNVFGKLKEYRGIATRCCKTDESFSAFISLAATVIRLR